MKSEKIKIETDLLRDSLRNIFVVMFAIMSGEVGLFYRLVKKVDILNLSMFVFGFTILLLLLKIKKTKKLEINNLLKQLED
jgi:hypothetical protein